MIERTRNILTKELGKLTVEANDFIHTGVRHVWQETELYMHQHEYLAQLHPMDIDKTTSSSTALEDEQKTTFWSLL
eukprot:1604047-Amphidinium_carterae.1